jgi:predicted glycosyltransferase
VNPVVFFYVQHLLGVGHLRRAAIIARALSRNGLAVRFVSGGRPIASLDLAAADFIQLPPAVAADTAFSVILDEGGQPIDDAWRARRRGHLLDAFAAERPDLLLVEMFPFGRRQFAFELLPLIEAAAARGIPVAVSLRDILVAKSKPARLAEIVDLVRRRIDRVLVHGDPRLVELEATFPAAAHIADRLVYTGYVADEEGRPLPVAAQVPDGEILVSTGGGAVGGPLLHAALAARPLSAAANAPWRLIAGPNLPEDEFAALAARAPAGVRVERFRSDFRDLLAHSRLSLSQAGYNTVMDILSVGARAVVVPFADGGESEQTLRARLLAERGLLTLVEPPVEAAPLARAIDAALARPRPSPGDIDLGGADATARELLAMVAG